MLDQRELRGRCAHPEGGHEPIRWDEIEHPVHARFERIVNRWPDRWAVEADDARYTYAELNRAANRIASALRRRLPGTPEPVGILMPHGAAPIVAVMGVLKAGHIFLGLDPADPPLRIRQIVEHAGARVVLCTHGTANAGVGGAQVLPVEDLAGVAGGGDEPGVAVPADSPASLYYTSGSTGKPKGVLYSHRMRMVTALRNTNGIRISRHDRLSLTYPTRYAGAANHTFGALLNGACVLPFDYAAHGAARLARFLNDKRITVYHSVPAMFRQAMQYAENGLTFESMRLLMLSSDSVYPSDLAEFSKHFPRTCLFSNSWGLSESPLFRPCFFAAGPVSGPSLAAIGCPLEDPNEENEVLILDEHGREVANGETGEIVVRSRYFATGYWRDPDQTAQRFLKDPDSSAHRRYATGDLGRRNADGTVVHLGRKDFQVQIGGERVEVAEIEAALCERGDVRAAVVVARPGDAGGDLRLIAYVTCAGQPPPLESDLRDYVAERLPRQMTPDRFVFCDSLQLTTAGKMDRRSLPAPPRERPRLRTPFEAPATALERDVAAIFGEVLELDGIGARDSFFELGGKSLGAMRVLAGIYQRFGARVEFAEFFAAPTPVALAATVELALTASQAEELLREIEAMPEDEARRLLDEQRP